MGVYAVGVSAAARLNRLTDRAVRAFIAQARSGAGPRRLSRWRRTALDRHVQRSRLSGASNFGSPVGAAPVRGALSGGLARGGSRCPGEIAHSAAQRREPRLTAPGASSRPCSPRTIRSRRWPVVAREGARGLEHHPLRKVEARARARRVPDARPLWRSPRSRRQWSLPCSRDRQPRRS